MPYVALFRLQGTPGSRREAREQLREGIQEAMQGDPTIIGKSLLLVGIDEPKELNLYREGDDFSPPVDIAIKAHFQSANDFFSAIGRFAKLPMVQSFAAYFAEETVKKSPRDEWNVGELPGVHMLHPLNFHADLSRSALLRSWRQIHGDLAVEAHAGGEYYSQLLVLSVVTPGAWSYGGFSEFHFPSEEALFCGYFASDAAKKAVRHDIRHFIDGIPPRMFAKAYLQAGNQGFR